MPPTLELTISPQGDTTLRTHGFTGPACQEASRFLEAALGEVVQDQKTAAFHATVPLQQHVRQ